MGTEPKPPPKLFQLEARIANALWTSFPDHLGGLDVGVGRRWVWVAAQHAGVVSRIDAWSGKLHSQVMPPGGGAKRISVSRPVTGVADAVEMPWVVGMFGFIQFFRSRLAGAGGTVSLAAWDVYAALPPQVKATYRKALETLLEKDRGIELLYCMAPIFTFRDRVPTFPINLRAAATKTENGKPYIDFTLLEDQYVAVLKELATVPGFADRVRYLSLGNEVDKYLEQWNEVDHPKAWSAYLEFCKSVISQMRSFLPRTQFGVNWTFQGMQNHQPRWGELMQSCDAAFVNYYAVNSGLQVLTPEEYASDFTKLIGLADQFGGGKPIAMQEVGMPTDPTLGGSYLAQAKFIEFLLKKWDELGIRIRFLSWFALYDYLYDSTLKVSLVDPTNVDSPIQVDASAHGEKWFTDPWGSPQPFFGVGNEIPGFFFGPYPPKPADHVYWLNQSTTPGTPAERLARFLSSCGLLAADGRPKHLPGLKPPPGKPTSTWDVFRSGLEKRRRQT
jgi:hypothetical protein